MHCNNIYRFHVAACLLTYIVIKCVKSVATYLNIYHQSEICGCTLIKITLASSAMSFCYKLQQITYNLATKINTRYSSIPYMICRIRLLSHRNILIQIFCYFFMLGLCKFIHQKRNSIERINYPA